MNKNNLLVNIFIRTVGIFIAIGIVVAFFSPSDLVLAADKCCVYYQSPLSCTFIHKTQPALSLNNISCYIVNDLISCDQLGSNATCNSNQYTLNGISGVIGVGHTDTSGAACPQLNQIETPSGAISVSLRTVESSQLCSDLEAVSSLKSSFQSIWNEQYKPTSIQGKQTTGVCRCVTASEIVHCSKEIPLSFDYPDPSQAEETFQAKLMKACKDYSIGAITCEPYPGQTMDGGMSSAVVAEPKCTYDFGQKSSGNKDGDLKTGGEFSLPSSNALNLLGTTDIRIVIGRMMKIAMGVMGSLALVIIIYGGLLWMTAAGNSEREGKALKVMFTAGIGVVIILSSYAIVTFVFSTL